MPIDTSIYSIPLNTPDPLSGLQKVAALKAAQQQQLIGAEQLKGARIENQERLQSIADDDAAKKLFAGVQAGGAMPGDSEILGTLGPKHGSVIVKALRDADKAKVDLQKTKSEVAEKEADYSGGLAAMVKDAGYSPAAVQLAIKHAHDAGYEQEAQQLQQLLAPENQDKIPALMDALIAKSPAQQKLITERQTSQARADQAANSKRETDARLPGIQADATQKQLVTTGMTGGLITNQADWDAWRAGLAPEIQSKIPAMYSPAAAQLVQQLGLNPDQRASLDLRAKEVAKLNSPAQLAAIATNPKSTQAERDAANAALKRLDQYQKEGAMGMQANFNLSPAALDMLSRNVAAGGALPPMGRNPGPILSKIYNNAAEVNPDLNLAGVKADYAANKASLTAITKNRDAVVAFENTALKNLDLFLDQAKGIIDTGSPYLNTPLRMISSKLVGSEKMAAYEAARRIAVNEVAKVTNNPGLAGALTDSGRKEVESFNPANATLAQTYAVAKVLKQDMGNRHKSYDQQIEEIRGRMGSGGNAPSPSASLPKGGGKVIDATTAKKFYEAAGNDPAKARQLAVESGWKVQ